MYSSQFFIHAHSVFYFRSLLYIVFLFHVFQMFFFPKKTVLAIEARENLLMKEIKTIFILILYNTYVRNLFQLSHGRLKYI